MSILVYEIRPKFYNGTLYHEVWRVEKNRKWYDLTWPICEYRGIFASEKQAEEAIRVYNTPVKEY